MRLAYGEGDLDIDVDPHRATIVEPVYRPAATDPRAALRAALRNPVAGPPLREKVKRGQTVAICACDGTRPQPRDLMIAARLGSNPAAAWSCAPRTSATLTSPPRTWNRPLISVRP